MEVYSHLPLLGNNSISISCISLQTLLFSKQYIFVPTADHLVSSQTLLAGERWIFPHIARSLHTDGSWWEERQLCAKASFSFQFSANLLPRQLHNLLCQNIVNVIMANVHGLGQTRTIELVHYIQNSFYILLIESKLRI